MPRPRVAVPEISLVVVTYEMERELPRTLVSLSPDCQKHCPVGRCEVIVVDNGSSRPPREADFAGLGLDLRVETMARPSSSPVPAVNHGLSLARAGLIGVMIDGARLASPGLLDACIRAAARHPRAIVATPNYHLGPAPQYVSMHHGYDRAEEDRLLASIDWPGGADRLFEIGTRIVQVPGEDNLRESNALVMPKALWEELGGYDAGFTSHGGGAANIDIFERACALPGTQLILIEGEATFHQVHGGVVSNAAGEIGATLKAVGAEYHRLRGRPMVRPRQTAWRFDSASGVLHRSGN